MGYIVTKDGMSMSVRDENQLSAFLNNGWTKKGEGAVKSAPSTPIIEKPEEKATDTALTKTDVNRMPNSELEKLCKANEINFTDMSGGEMKKALIEKLGL